jgi:hypothetical protein
MIKKNPPVFHASYRQWELLCNNVGGFGDLRELYSADLDSTLPARDRKIPDEKQLLGNKRLTRLEMHWDRCQPASKWHECSLGHVARVVRHGGVSVRSWVEPDLVTSGSVAIKSETAHLQLPNDLAIPES